MLLYLGLLVNVFLSAIGGLVTFRILPRLKNMFIKANLCGIDMSKKTQQKVPEAMGVVCGCIYLMIMFLFLAIQFSPNLFYINRDDFPHDKFVEIIAALLSVCCMLFLGFADDVLDLRWRDKLLLPTMASVPLLMVYYVTFNSTTIIIPKPFRFLFGFDLDLSVLYYVYMGMLAVFCTNAINIYAGINGLECGQSMIIAISIIAFNISELMFGLGGWAHQFSLYFMIPYVAVIIPLLYYNWYPSEVFVGDTFCYFSGMLFAVVGILGHFSKTMLLFFIPQVFNFLYSIPQLFHQVPCPRHRLPRYDAATDKMHLSYTTFKVDELPFLGKIFFRIFSLFRIIEVKQINQSKSDDTVSCNNFTLINLLIRFMGPMNERNLTAILLSLQVVCSLLAFCVRYPLARLCYDI